jgi:hypothetical protein
LEKAVSDPSLHFEAERASHRRQKLTLARFSAYAVCTTALTGILALLWNMHLANGAAEIGRSFLKLIGKDGRVIPGADVYLEPLGEFLGKTESNGEYGFTDENLPCWLSIDAGELGEALVYMTPSDQPVIVRIGQNDRLAREARSPPVEEQSQPFSDGTSEPTKR